MLTYNNDIYKRILKPLDIQYYSAEFPKGKYVIPRTTEEAWKLIFPEYIRESISLISFTAMNSGKADNKYGTDGRRIEMKRHLLARGNKYYPAMTAHINHLIKTNAAIRVYCEITGKNLKYHELYSENLEVFIQENSDLVKEEVAELSSRLSSMLRSTEEEILSDKRIQSNLNTFIPEKIDEAPGTVLEILCLLSLFAADDNDEEFYRDFAYHYCIDDGHKEDMARSNHQDKTPHELTNTTVLGTDESEVLFREEEIQNITDLLALKTKSVLLSGFGGCGKTSIARLLYFALKDNYDYYGWINYTNNLKQSMISSINLENYSDETMTENDADKKWKYILKMLAGSRQTKLLVIDNADYIDGVQNPLKDEDLMALPGWNNVKIIVTSRLPEMLGYGTVYHIENLGNYEQYDNCVELFYHYNKDAAKYRHKNIETVRRLCEMAGFNTMVIELLAKGSMYDSYSLDEFYEKLQKVGFKYVDEVPVRAAHDLNVLSVRNEDGSINEAVDYYNIGCETAASQLMKLFNLKMRSKMERMILWDFHRLPEAEKVSRDELKNWMGYSIKDINSLKEEGWIKYEDGMFSIHPLIRQAILCVEDDWRKYWKYGEEHRKNISPNETLVTLVKKQCFYNEEDSFLLSLRKIKFTDYLTYGGIPLDSETLLYVADYARERGAREVGKKYYKAAYEKTRAILSEMGVLTESFLCITDGKLPKQPLDIDDPLQIGFIKLHIDEKLLPIARLFWRSTYYYGYMVSYTMSGYDEAVMFILQAYYILLGMEETAEVLRSLAKTLDHLGYILSNHLKDNCGWVLCAEYYLKTAVGLRQRIVENDLQKNMDCLHDLAWSQDNLGNLYAMLDADKMDANTSVVFGVSLLNKYFMNCDKETIIVSGSKLVEDLQTGIMFQQAEFYLKEALKVREAIAKYKGYDKDTEVAWTLCNLAALLSQDESRYAEAEELITRALYLYEELDKTCPEQHMSSAARTYTVYARLLAKWDGHEDEAMNNYAIAHMLNKKLEKDYPGIYVKEIEMIEREMRTVNSLQSNSGSSQRKSK